MLEDDHDLKMFRDIYSRYAIKEFVMVAYEPKADLFLRRISRDPAPHAR